ncbi:hypothetical protein, partial [Novosphingobium sp.]|uniref:hypothetical protein n=1 Tax=Novosphingobium sp. TaxID=1874826 RepID=UPI002B46F86F
LLAIGGQCCPQCLGNRSEKPENQLSRRGEAPSKPTPNTSQTHFSKKFHQTKNAPDAVRFAREQHEG